MIMYMYATLTFICTCMHKCFLFVICFILLLIYILSYFFFLISLCISLLIYHFYVNIKLFKIEKWKKDLKISKEAKTSRTKGKMTKNKRINE